MSLDVLFEPDTEMHPLRTSPPGRWIMTLRLRKHWTRQRIKPMGWRPPVSKDLGLHLLSQPFHCPEDAIEPRDKRACPRPSTLNIHWKDWRWSWSFNTLATWGEELICWKRPWCWEWLRARGEGGDRGWDGWMTSPTQWTWVWANSGR